MNDAWKLKLSVNDWIEFEDERHQIIRLRDSTVELRSESGVPQVVAVAALVADPSFQTKVRPPDKPAGPVLDHTAVLDGLPDAERTRVIEMQAHLYEATTGFRSGDPDQAADGEPRPTYDPALPLNTRMEAKATELGITTRRLYQLLDAWRSHGLWGLVDKRKTRPRNPLAGTDWRIIEAIREQYTAEIHDSAGTIGNRFRRRVQNRLDTACGPGTVTLPSKRTFYRLVDLLLDRSPGAPSGTKRSAANQPDRPFTTIQAERPGEIVMMDTTPLDVLAYDQATNDYVGVELTYALDVATRCMLGWRLTAEGTKSIDVGGLLADAITPEPMRPDWPNTLRFSMLRVPYERMLDFDTRLAEAAARPVIFPESIIIDHGKPYQSDVMMRACDRMGISVVDARKLKPTDKPHVESTFNTIRLDFSENVAGYKGRDVAHRGRDVEKTARWTIAELEELFAEYIVAVYQRRWHSGLFLPGFPDLRMSPNEAYAQALARTGFVVCPTDPNLYYELLPICWRTIQPYGVEIDSLIYNDDHYALYNHRGATAPYTGKHAGKWPIRQDPRDRLHAYFQDLEGTWHVLRWTHALDEHRPFTDTTLREAKRLLVLRGINNAEQDDIAATLLDLQNRIDAPESWTRTDRKRLSRDAERARAAARDRHRATPAQGEHHPNSPVPLSLVTDLDEPDETDETGPVIDLSDLESLEVWNPHAASQED